MTDDDRDRPPEGGVAVARRAPFSDNPRVGARGLRTQQRILDAALLAFGDVGYHACSIDRITKVARCSRVSFYQYFANKEDVFAHLAGQVARQLSASTDALAALTPDVAGWLTVRSWVTRYAETYARYEPVFHAYETDDALGALAAHSGEETVARIQSRLVTTLPPRQLDPVVRMLLATTNHMLGVTGILRSVVPDAYPEERIELAITDVIHRTFFGLQPSVNVHESSCAPSPALYFGPEMRVLLRERDARTIRDASGNRALAALLTSARDVFIARGYHNTRVDDVVAAAGVSHGAFYRYFRNKHELARMLTARALRVIGAEMIEIPDLAVDDETVARPALRRWLRRYNAAHAHESAMLRVWVDAALEDPALRADSAANLDYGRRRWADALGGRGFGDVDIDAVVLVALLGVFGARQRGTADVDAAVHIIERGLLGR
jgi:AcrR family transcriptional regulator